MPAERRSPTPGLIARAADDDDAVVGASFAAGGEVRPALGAPDAARCERETGRAVARHVLEERVDLSAFTITG